MPLGFYEYTAQETFLIGDSAATGDMVRDGKFRMPYGIYNKQISIDALNQERAERRFFNCLPVRSLTGESNAVVSFEPINPLTGEAERRPQVLLHDKKTGEVTYSKEVTDRFYEAMEKEGFALPGETRDMAIFDSFFREDSREKEGEGITPPEGMRNV